MPPRGPDSVDPATRLGTVLSDRYRLDDLLGEGAMGSVYLAEHVLMRKRVAVKILHRELTSVPEAVARFEREAMASANIDHENVAGATDFGKLPNGAVFLVLEYVEGRNLRDEIARGRFEVRRALHIARQIASALAAAHAMDIVHRDLKPENILLLDKGGDSDFVKILDFGIAKAPAEGAQAGPKPITRVGLVVGTPEYMAPEQALGEIVDGRADLYALGVMLFEMLAGARPYESRLAVDVLGQQLSGPVPRLVDRAPGLVVPPLVEQVVMTSLAPKKEERYASADAVVSAIDAAAQDSFGGLPLAAPVSSPESALPPVSMPSDVAGASGTLPGVGVAGAPPPSGPVGSLPGAGPTLGGVPGMHGPLGPGFDRVLESVRESYRQFDERRRGWPRPLSDLPTPALLGGLAFVVLLVVVLIGVAIGGGGSEEGEAKPLASSAPSAAGPIVAPVAASAEPAGRAPAEELAKAAEQGADALRDLAERYPTDPRPHVERAKILRGEKKYEAAVKAIASALKVDARASELPEVATTLFTTAQKGATRDATFELLSGSMGAKGADIIYDLATQDGIKPALRRRAERWLASDEFDKQSSPALHILVSLRAAKTCRQRHALLLRAKNVGEWRTLDYLKKLQKKTGCGPGGAEDCHPCLRDDDRLEAAITAIDARQSR